MTKDLQDDLHNIFSAIFSGRKANIEYMKDLRLTVNILNEYLEGGLKTKFEEESWNFYKKVKKTNIRFGNDDE